MLNLTIDNIRNKACYTNVEGSIPEAENVNLPGHSWAFPATACGSIKILAYIERFLPEGLISCKQVIFPWSELTGLSTFSSHDRLNLDMKRS